MHYEYPVLENKCSLSGIDDFSRNDVVGDLRGGGGWDLLVLPLRVCPLPAAVGEGSSMKRAATMASSTNRAPNRNGAPENCNKTTTFIIHTVTSLHYIT